MKKNLLSILGILIAALIAFCCGYLIGYQKAEKDLMEYIHREVPNFEDSQKKDENTDPVI